MIRMPQAGGVWRTLEQDQGGVQVLKLIGWKKHVERSHGKGGDAGSGKLCGYFGP